MVIALRWEWLAPPGPPVIDDLAPSEGSAWWASGRPPRRLERVRIPSPRERAAALAPPSAKLSRASRRARIAAHSECGWAVVRAGPARVLCEVVRPLRAGADADGERGLRCDGERQIVGSHSKVVEEPVAATCNDDHRLFFHRLHNQFEIRSLGAAPSRCSHRSISPLDLTQIRQLGLELPLQPHLLPERSVLLHHQQAHVSLYIFPSIKTPSEAVVSDLRPVLLPISESQFVEPCFDLFSDVHCSFSIRK